MITRSIILLRKKINNNTYILLIGSIILILLFKNGYIFSLDIIPRINRYEMLNLFYGKDISIYGISKMLASINFFQRILPFIILFLSGYSIYSLIDSIMVSKMTKYYASLLYILNPYTYIRIVAGPLYLLFSYAILPLLLKFFIELLEKQQTKEMAKFIFVLSIVAFNIHMLIISLIIMIIIFMFWFNKHKDIRIIKYIVLSAVLFILLNSYWIIPVLTAKDTIVDNITYKDYEVFSPKGSLFDIASMYGFWREGYIYAKDFISGWQILYLIILSLAILGFLTYYRDKKIGYLVKAFGFIAILGLILALGIKGPLYPLYEFDNIILKGLRDSHKFVAMLALSYSVLGGFGLNKLEEVRRKIST